MCHFERPGLNKWGTVALISLILISSTLVFSVNCWSDWEIETVDSSASVGWFTSLALDSSGYPHISYEDDSNEELKCAYHDGSSWNYSVVDADGEGRSSLALDSTDNLHLSYQSKSGGNLIYAYNDGSGWSFTTVDSAFQVGNYSSLALESSGHPYISYFEKKSGGFTGTEDLKYASYDGSSWNTERVASDGYVGLYTSLAIDSGDNPHICYMDWTNKDVDYAWKAGGSWSHDVVQSDEDVGYDISLALDSSDLPHVAYRDGTNKSLKYAYYDGSNKIIKTVDKSENVGREVSLALDSEGNPHISYYDAADDDLKYAYRNGSSWEIAVVDSAGDVGYYTSIELDPFGNPHISYQDRTNENLKYAYFNPLEVTAPDGGESWQVGTTHEISWADEDSGDLVKLKYSTDGGNSWETISSSTENDGSYNWTVPDEPSASYLVKVTSVEVPAISDRSEDEFLVHAGPTAAKFRVDEQGNVYADKAFHGQAFKSGNADLAEKVNVTGKVEPGDVLSLDPEEPSRYRKSTKPYSSLVVGVVSTQPGVTLSEEAQTSSATLALMGTVPVKATTENGPIQPGNLLTTSSKAGYAMVCKNRSKCSGAVIGKALESLGEGEGKILMLVVA